MKTRLGFVTNSSSSSFILGLKKNENNEYSEETIKALTEFAIEMLEDVTEDKITDVNELEKMFLEEYGYETLEEFAEEEEYYYKRFLEAKATIENGGTVYMGCISDECYDAFGPYEMLFKKLRGTKDFTDIQTELGY